MHNILRRALYLVVVLAILLSCIVPTSFAAKSATTPTGYTDAGDVDYVKVGSYVANWGARGEVATFLSTDAQSFYTGSNTYDNFINYSGGSTQSNASSSALYSQLKSFMTGKHKTQTSYDATKSLYKYTDCVHGNYNNISSFYSGTVLGGSWGSSPSWNREHTWPNSKGLGGNDENDIMMLRPTATSENSSRGNTAYGESSKYYDPNSESGGQYNLRGDCARIVLYVYVRWGNTGYMWGQSGVMENLDVLLKWMEEDPVDTWEMGRNDAVQSITGTRNVFIDYPELAWKLFGREIPDDMPTPSGEAGGSSTPIDPDCPHTSTQLQGVSSPSCEGIGYTGDKVCLSCGGRLEKGTTIPALGHNWQPLAGNKEKCQRCGVERTTASIATTLNNGDKVVIAVPAYNKLLSMITVSSYYKKGVDYTNNDFSVATNNEIFTVKANSDGSYTFTSLSGKTLAASTGTYYSLDDSSTQNKWTLQAVSGKTGVYNVKNTAQAKYLRWDSAHSDWSSSSSASGDQNEVSFYLIEAATPCTHANTEIRGASSASCTANGYSGDTYCKSCGAKVASGTTVPMTGHDWEPLAGGGEKCGTCGATQGIVLPPVCAHSATEIRNYSAASCTADGYSGDTYCKSCGAKVASGTTIPMTGHDWEPIAGGGEKCDTCGEQRGTVTPPSGGDDEQPGGTVTPPSGGDDEQPGGTVTPPSPSGCGHENTEKRGAKAATCTEMGYSGDTYCVGCGQLVKSGTVTMTVDHDYQTVDGKEACTMCGEEKAGGLTPAAQTGITIGAVSLGGGGVIAVILFLIFKRRPI